MKKLSEIFEVDKLPTSTNYEQSVYAEVFIDGVKYARREVDKFEIDYEFLAKEITYSRYGSVWVDLPTSKKSEYIEITKKIISPEKLFKKKVG